MQPPKTYTRAHLHTDSMNAEVNAISAKHLNEGSFFSWQIHVKEARMYTEQNVDADSSGEPVRTLVSELQHK